MKRVHFLLLVMVLLSATSAQVVHAQAGIPPTPTGPLGEIHGTVINATAAAQ